MQLVDIGANLSHPAFRDDLDAVLARARQAGVAQIIVTGTTVAESREAASLAEEYALHATAGVHPHRARDCDSSTIPALRDLAKHPRVVAIGECGLDFNRNYSPHPDQEKWFVAQLELGIEIGKPLFLHSRDAHPRFAEILKHHQVKNAVAHCFTGERQELEAYLDLGLYIGITGWICDERRGRHVLELVRDIPRDRLLLETDSPYLVPRDMKPQPKGRRNEPAFLPHIARTVARALGRPVEEIAAETKSNARDLFAALKTPLELIRDGAQRPLSDRAARRRD
jgi:TatD DNase family protein